MYKYDKLVMNYVVFFVILGVMVGLIIGNFFTFFPGSLFILSVTGGFVGLITGFVIGTIVKFIKIKQEKDKYNI